MVKELLKSLAYPREMRALISHLKAIRKDPNKGMRLDAVAKSMDDMKFCYVALVRVSRSFAAVIQQLPEEVRDAVCIFYLVLRGLDTIEDDTSIPKDRRIDLMLDFAENFMSTEYALSGVGDDENYRDLLKNFPKVARAFNRLDPRYQEVITNITLEMSKGMRKYAYQEVETVREYDEYCYYVAGLVGLGLTRLFTASGLEPALSELPDSYAISMGLFLQKTNITRDVHEDTLANRIFWPAEIYSHYHNSLEDYIQHSSDPLSIEGLNHMVGNALVHADDCLIYLSRLTDPRIFMFCAIPQVMAMSTLSLMYSNQEVFEKNVKIRKGQAVWLMQHTCNIDALLDHYRYFAEILMNKMQKDPPVDAEILTLIKEILDRKTWDVNQPPVKENADISFNQQDA